MARLRYSFALPVLAAGVVGAFIGWVVTGAGCVDGSCGTLTKLAVALISGAVAAAGVGIVVVLADRSLREWRQGPGSGLASPDGDGAERRE